MKKVKLKRAVLLVLLLTCLLSSCGTKTTEHSIGDLTITLPDHFLEFDCEGYTACFEGNDVAVFILQELATEQNGLADLTLPLYAEKVRDANASKNPTEILSVEGITFFEYDFLNEQEERTYSYCTAVFKGEYSFWLVQFATLSDEYESKKPDFLKWAKTVTLE